MNYELRNKLSSGKSNELRGGLDGLLRRVVRHCLKVLRTH